MPWSKYFIAFKRKSNSLFSEDNWPENILNGEFQLKEASLDVVGRRPSVERRQPTIVDASERRLVERRQIFEDVVIDSLQTLGLEQGGEVVTAELHARSL